MSSSIPKESEPIVKMLSMLTVDGSDANRTLLLLANSPESCQSLRSLGCIPLLIQILYPTNTLLEARPSSETRIRAAKALKNIIAYNPNEQLKRKEMKIFKLLETIRNWNGNTDSHPIESLMIIMKYSFYEEHRKIMSLFGSIQAIASLIQLDIKHTQQEECIMTRRYGCIILSNLSYCTDGMNKSILCSMKDFMIDLSNLLENDNEDICGNVANIFRNLSWDGNTNNISSLQNIIQECNVIPKLIQSALKCTRESTLKSTLHAIWNLSSFNINKNTICSSLDAIKFLITQMESKNLTVQQISGGIIKNISSSIVNNEPARRVCFQNHLYEILLQQLRSSSLTIVQNSSGTLLNLSSCPEAQKILRKLNAIPVLEKLVFSKKLEIADGAKVALHNLIGWQENEPLDLSQSSQNQSNGNASSASSTKERTSTPNTNNTSITKKPPFLNPPIVNLKTYSCPNFIENSDTIKTFCYEGTPNSHSITDLTLITDETVKYFTEHTPANFSRTSSLSSLNSRGGGRERVCSENVLVQETQETERRQNQHHGNNRNGDTSMEEKKVQINEVPGSITDTPLMFSRCSSVESLESFGELNMPESDANSKYSNSVRQSEVVSPSEDLPEMYSPAGKSPRTIFFPPLKSSNINKCHQQQELESGQMSIRSLSPLTVDGEMVGIDVKLSEPMPIVHEEKKEEDELKFFAVEGTPFGISTATSLSDLTCEFKDDLEGIKEDLTEFNEPDEKDNGDRKEIENKVDEIDRREENEITENNLQNDENTFEKDKDNNGRIDEDDEDKCSKEENDHQPEEIYSDAQILMKCIRAGKASMTKSKSDYFVKKDKIHLKNDTDIEKKEENQEQNDEELLALIMKGKKMSRVNHNNNNNNHNLPTKSHRSSIMTKSLSENVQFNKSIPYNTDTKEILLKFPSLSISNNQNHTESMQAIKQAKDKNHNQSKNLVKNVPDKSCNNFDKSMTAHSVVNSKHGNNRIAPTASMEQSIISLGSEWNDETPTISTSIPSMSISTALKIVNKQQNHMNQNQNETNTNSNNLNKPDLLIRSGMFKSEFSQSAEYLENILPPNDLSKFDLENSMMSIASIKSEIAPCPQQESTFTHHTHSQPKQPHSPSINNHHNRNGNSSNLVARGGAPPIPPKPKTLPPFRPTRSTVDFNYHDRASAKREPSISPNSSCKSMPVAFIDGTMHVINNISPTTSGPTGSKQKKTPPPPPMRNLSSKSDSKNHQQKKYNTLPKNLGRSHPVSMNNRNDQINVTADNGQSELNSKDKKENKKVGKLAGFWNNLKTNSFKDVWVKRGVEDKPEVKAKPFDYTHSNSNKPHDHQQPQNQQQQQNQRNSKGGEKITTV